MKARLGIFLNCALLVAWGLSDNACRPSPKPKPRVELKAERSAEPPARSVTVTPSEAPVPSHRREVYAVWYRVPADSLARRRAGKDEFTAAHNHLPLGTAVRVTNVENGKDVIVHITDRGVPDRRAQIDICKEAAEKIGILSAGLARVRLDIVTGSAEAIAAETVSSAAH